MYLEQYEKDLINRGGRIYRRKNSTNTTGRWVQLMRDCNFAKILSKKLILSDIAQIVNK